MSLDNGERLNYFDTVSTMWASENGAPISAPRIHRIVGNWYVFIMQFN